MENLSKKQKIVLVCLIFSLIVVIALIITLIKFNDDDSNSTAYVTENVEIFTGVDNSEATSEDDEASDDSEIDVEKISEEQKYLESGLVSEFVSLDFSYVDVDRTSLKTYYNKLIGFYKENNTEAMLANLNYDYVKKYNINASNVADVFKKNGINSDYKIENVQFWGVNHAICVVKLKNQISGASHTIGINMKMESNCQIFNFYPEEFFNACGFELKDNQVLKIDGVDLTNNFNIIQKNEYNFINI